MRRHIERHLGNLKERPEHVRQRVAMGTAAGITGLIAVIWLTSHVAGGSFAMNARTPAEDDAPAFADTREGFTQFLGAVGSSMGATSSDPALTIVDGNTTTTLAPQAPPQNQTDDTVIAF